MENKNIVIVPVGISEKKIAERIKEIIPNEVLIFFIQSEMSERTGGPLGGGAITVELNPQHKPMTTQLKYLCKTFDVEGESIKGLPDIVFSVDSPNDIADRIYFRTIQL